MSEDALLHHSYSTLLDLATEEGINASGRNEIYGCIFGRDTSITVLKILRAYARDKTGQLFDRDKLLSISRQALLTLASLQGTITNIETGEEPGKFIHEFRKDRYEHLIKISPPWFINQDKVLRNYDSIDSTPLMLIAIYRFWQITKDSDFLEKILPFVEKGLIWLLFYADRDHDRLVEYEFHKSRRYGGLLVQSWTDSHESLRQADGQMPLYPIAPVEVQGYVWLAFRLWSDFYSDTDSRPMRKSKAKTLLSSANHLKKIFNKKFIIEDNNLYFAAQALDGLKRQIRTITGNPLLLLWSSYEKNGIKESIIEYRYINDFVKRAFMSDLFDYDAGLRTMSAFSATYNPRQDSYHNGSFWPKLNGLVYEGLHFWEFMKEADQLKNASIKPLVHFGAPVELYIKNEKGEYMEFKNGMQTGCRQQAWSAATVLDLLTA